MRGRKPNAIKDAALKWMVDNNATAQATASHFGTSVNNVRYWVRLEKDKLPTATNLVALPAPSPKVLPPDLTEECRAAVRKMLSEISQRDYTKESIRDIAIVLKTITDAYELLPSVDGKKDTTQSGNQRLVSALLGDTLLDDASKDKGGTVATTRAKA